MENYSETILIKGLVKIKMLPRIKALYVFPLGDQKLISKLAELALQQEIPEINIFDIDEAKIQPKKLLRALSKTNVSSSTLERLKIRGLNMTQKQFWRHICSSCKVKRIDVDRCSTGVTTVQDVGVGLNYTKVRELDVDVEEDVISEFDRVKIIIQTLSQSRSICHGLKRIWFSGGDFEDKDEIIDHLRTCGLKNAKLAY